MARNRFTCSSVHPYHITSRSNNRENYKIPMEDVWRIMSAYLYFIATSMNVRIHSFVLMNNHFHLLASFPDANLSSAMLYFMRETSKAMGVEGHRINHIYGSRVNRSRIESFHHYMNVYKYVYRNPVEVGLSPTVASYRYSTLSGIIGAEKLLFPVVDDTLIFDSALEETLAWLDRSIGRSDLLDIRNALKRAKFQLRKNGRRPHGLDSQLC